MPWILTMRRAHDDDGALRGVPTPVAVGVVYCLIVAAHTVAFVTADEPSALLVDALEVLIVLDLGIVSFLAVVFWHGLCIRSVARAQWSLVSIVAVLLVAAWHVRCFLDLALRT